MSAGSMYGRTAVTAGVRRQRQRRRHPNATSDLETRPSLRKRNSHQTNRCKGSPKFKKGEHERCTVRPSRRMTPTPDGSGLEVECLARHLDDSDRRLDGVECPARHLKSDRGQERGGFREKGARAVSRPATKAGDDGFGRCRGDLSTTGGTLAERRSACTANGSGFPKMGQLVAPLGLRGRRAWRRWACVACASVGRPSRPAAVTSPR